MELAVQAIVAPGSDYIVKPLDLDRVTLLNARNYEPFSINQLAINEIGL